MSSIINLDENFYLEADTYNWMLKYEKKEEKDGKIVTSKDEWYYPTIQGCLRKYVSQASKTCSTVAELVEKLKEINKTIDRVCLS